MRTGGKCQVAQLASWSSFECIGPLHSPDQPISKQYLHSEDESGGVERIFSVQLTIDGEGAADVVQSEDAVGVS